MCFLKKIKQNVYLTQCGRALVRSSTPTPRFSVCAWISPQALYATLVHSLDTSAIWSRPLEVVPPRTNNPSGRLMTGLLAASARLQLLSQRPNVGQLHLGEADTGSPHQFFIPRLNLVPLHENTVLCCVYSRKSEFVLLGGEHCAWTKNKYMHWN